MDGLIDFIGGFLIPLFLGAMLLAFPFIIYFAYQEDKANNKRYGELMAQCKADGKKEYECEALLKRPKSSGNTYVPIIIPTYVR